LARADATPGLREFDSVVADAVEEAIAILSSKDFPDRHVAVLRLIQNVCRAFVGEPGQTIDANLMTVVAKDSIVRTGKGKCRPAEQLFAEFFDEASEILSIRASTNPTYLGFWVPIFDRESHRIPGAPAAYRTLDPQVVFTRCPLVFGDGIPEYICRSVREYFGSVAFRVFLSFPLTDKRSGAIVGVVNVNIVKDELGFHDRNQVHALYIAIRPLLAILSSFGPPTAMLALSAKTPQRVKGSG
jgi:hypothetical protein